MIPTKTRKPEMKISKVQVIFFSPSGGTKKIAAKLASSVADKLGVPMESLNLTLPADRDREYSFGPEDLVIMATPVYAGRVPNKIEPDLRRILRFSGSPAVALTVFGNRSYGTAPEELADILRSGGAHVIAAGAFVSRHVFSDQIARRRPDREDKAELGAFGEKIVDKVTALGDDPSVGELTLGEIGPYYKPLKEDGTPAAFLKAKPVTDVDKCYFCRFCVRSCPMGSIDQDCVTVSGVCIKCHACVRCCPEKAKHFEDEDFLSHVRMLEKNYSERAENKIFI